MIVAFEGIDGVGKTSVAQEVAARCDWPLQGIPPPDLRLVDPELLRDVRSPARYLYYLAAAMRLGEHVARMVAETVVVDRYVDSVHAMHAPLQPELATTLRAVPVLQPDVVILLEAEEPVRRQRLDRRGTGALDPYEESLLNDDFRSQVSAEYRRREDAVLIDTSELSISDVVDRCITKIRAI